MKISQKKIGALVGLLLLVTACVILLFSAKSTTQIVHAIAPNEIDATFSYTRLNETDCEVRISNPDTATKANIPAHVTIDDNQYRVTEVALNGFMSSTYLKRVTLPYTIKKIGNTAFANCTALENIFMVNVEYIGNNVFMGCDNLENIVIPESVYHMGSYVFRSCSTIVRVRAATVGSDWSTKWNSNNLVQEVEFNSNYCESTILEPIYEMTRTRSMTLSSTLIGYSVAAGQPYAEAHYSNETIIIPAFENGFPVLVIEQYAYYRNNFDRLIVENSSQSISIETGAFFQTYCNSIIINRDIDYTDKNNDNGLSENIFASSTVNKIVLPYETPGLCNAMFQNCGSLENIYFISPSGSIDTENIISDLSDENSIGIVKLPVSNNFTKIGESAFSRTYGIKTLCIPNNVKTVESKILDGWRNNQSVEIDFTCGQLPDRVSDNLGWHMDWDSNNSGQVLYSKYRITFDACGGEMEEKYLDVARDKTIGQLPNPSKAAADFGGWYTQEKGLGEQYDGSEKLNNENITLYAFWALLAKFDSNGGSSCKDIAGVEGDTITLPSSTLGGYKGRWINDSNNYEYNFGSEYTFSDGSVNFTAEWTEKTFDELKNSSGIYEIWTENQLNYLNEYGMGGHYFMLMSDFDLEDNWGGISEFNGILDGNNHNIKYKNSTVPYGKNYGFICFNRGTIKNIKFQPTISNVSDKPNSNDKAVIFGVGGAVGVNYGRIENVNVNRTVSNPYMDSNGNHAVDIYSYYSTWLNIGGIVGANYSVVDSCTNYASIAGGNSMAGIVGLNYKEARILNCKNNGKIYFNHSTYATVTIGGVVGTVQDKGYIKNCTTSSSAIITWAAKLNASDQSTPLIGRFAGQAYETVTSENNSAFGKVEVVDDVYFKLSTSQKEFAKDQDVGKIVKAPSSSGGSSGGGCVASGTLITLSNGTQLPVEALTGNEELLVWNMFTGTFDVAPILFIDSDSAEMFEVINLYFSDGTEVEVISEHAFWDFDLNQYVFLRNDASKYIGHWFNKQTQINGEFTYSKVQLVDVTISEKYTMAWSPVTYGHLCYYVNGMLSMPGATEGLINIFNVDAETMRYDETSFIADIETYGLFTYEEFNEYLPVSYEVFEAFGGQYLKVSIGKGLIDFETLADLLNRYSDFL